MLTYRQSLLLQYLESLGMNLAGRAAVMGALWSAEAVDEMLLYILDHPEADQAELFETALKISSKIPEEEEDETEE